MSSVSIRFSIDLTQSHSRLRLNDQTLALFLLNFLCHQMLAFHFELAWIRVVQIKTAAKIVSNGLWEESDGNSIIFELPVKINYQYKTYSKYRTAIMFTITSMMSSSSFNGKGFNQRFQIEEWDGTWTYLRNSEKPEQQQKDSSSTDVPLVFFAGRLLYTRNRSVYLWS